MPQPPGYLNEFQFIKFFILTTCRRPWTLYVEFAFQPTVQAADTLLALDIPQIARTLFRPGQARTKRHGKKSSPKRRPPYTKVPDPNETAAQVLRDTFDIGDRVVADGPRFLWTLLDIGERFIGKMFILGVVEDWLYHYALYIDAGAGADCGLPAVRAQGGGTRTGNPGFAEIGGVNSIWEIHGATCFNGIVFVPAGRWMCTCTGSIQNTGHEPGDRGDVTVTIGARDSTTHQLIGQTTTKTISYMGSSAFVATVFFDNNENQSTAFYVEQHDNPGCATESSDIVIFAQAF